MHEVVQNFLKDLETKQIFDILFIGPEFRALLKSEEPVESDELAELYALNFFPQQEEGRETYTYGPQWVLPDANNKVMMVEFPSRSLVNQAMINYWNERIDRTESGVLKSRYADLVFDFADDTDKKLKYGAALKVIEANYALIPLTDKAQRREYASRGLFLVKLTKNRGYQSKYLDLLLKIGHEDSNFCGYVFTQLISNKYWRTSLSKEQIDQVISDVEQYVANSLSTTNPPALDIDELTVGLAKYYAEQDDGENVERVIGGLEAAYRKNDHFNSSGILKSNYLENLRTIYENFSQFEFARQKRDAITNELTSLANEIEASMQEHSFEVRLIEREQQQVEGLLLSLFEEEGKPLALEATMLKFVIHFLPRLNKQQESFEEITKQHPLNYLITRTLVGEDGFNIAKFNGLDEDRDKYFIAHYAQNLEFGALFLRMAFEELIQRFKPDDLYAVLVESPVFRKEDEAYIKRALNGFWQKDFLVSSHLFIPLIEDAFRNIHRIIGLPIIKTNEDGGFDYYNDLKRYIDHEMITAIFGEDFRYYAKVLLVKRIGWNLRHNFAHGISKSSFLSPGPSDRLLHLLFCLSLIRTEKD